MPQTEEDFLMFISKLEDLLNTIKFFDNDIELYMLTKDLWTDEDYRKQSILCENYSDKILIMIANLKISLKSLNDGQPIPSNIVSPKAKLPHLELPTFNGESDNFEKFMTTFESYIKKYNYTSFEKYSYLLKQVSGPAYEIIKCVDIKSAKSLLMNFFSDKTNQIYCVIEKIANLKFNPKNPYHWFSETKSLVAQIKRLEIDGNLFAQYFLWKSLGEKYKQLYVGIVNKSKPTLNEILENSFEMIMLGKHQINKVDGSSNGSKIKNQNIHTEVKGTVALVTQVSKDKKVISTKDGCWLCQLTECKDWKDHKIWNCHNYKTPQGIINKIKELNGCLKCGKPFHFYKNCRFKFSQKCKNCNYYHAEFFMYERA